MEDVAWTEFQKRLSSLMDSFYALLPEDKPQAIGSVRECIGQMQSALKQQLCSDAMRTVAAMAESLIQETYGIQPNNKPGPSTDFNGISSPDAIMFPQLDPSGNDTNDILTSALYESLKTVNGGPDYGSPLHSTTTVSSYSDILNLNSSTPSAHPPLDFRDVHSNSANWNDNESRVVISRMNEIVQVNVHSQSPSFILSADKDYKPTNSEQKKTDETIGSNLDGKLLSCSSCPFKTKHRQNLHRHMKLHKSSTLQNRPFPCDKCDKSFKTLSSLNEHNAYIHSARKTLKCPQCEKCFAQQKDVNRHVKSHNEERAFVCQCGKSYKSNFHLSRHALSSHAK